jgi:hypothetical protein
MKNKYSTVVLRVKEQGTKLIFSEPYDVRKRPNYLSSYHINEEHKYEPLVIFSRTTGW